VGETGTQAIEATLDETVGETGTVEQQSLVSNGSPALSPSLCGDGVTTEQAIIRQ